MDQNPLTQGVLTENFVSTGPDTRAKLHLRAQELASAAGHTAPHITQTNYEQAKREVGGEPPQLRPQAHPGSVWEGRHS